VGGSGMEEFAESIKFEENIDLLLPMEYIDYIDHKRIKLKTRVSELQLTKTINQWIRKHKEYT